VTEPVKFLSAPQLYGLCPSSSCRSVFKWDHEDRSAVSNGYKAHLNASACRNALISKFPQKSMVSSRTKEGTNWKAVKATTKYAQVAGSAQKLQVVFTLPDDLAPPSSFDVFPSKPLNPAPLAPVATAGVLETPHLTENHQPYIAELGWDNVFPSH
jgi:hypothetical protein